MIDNFSWWENALKGTRGPIHADEPMSGFYRQRRQDKTYEPVAYWKDSATGEQRCHINGKSVDLDRMMHVWPFASKNPISAEAYWHRMDTGQWADNDASAAAAAKGPEIDPGINNQNAEASLKTEIAAALKSISNYAVIESDEAAAKAQTLRSHLTKLKGSAQKRYDALSEPLLGELESIRRTWFPIRDSANDGASAIRAALESWENIKRENQRRADEENRKRQEEAIERHDKDAAQALVDGRIEPDPPPTVKPNTPPPAAQIKGASGRAASVSTKKVVTAIDLDKAWAQFAAQPEVYQLFMELAQRAVTAGIACPCATIEEKAAVR